MSNALAKRLNTLEARLTAKAERMAIIRRFVAPDRDISPEVTGVECSGAHLERNAGETREALHERALNHFKPVGAGVVRMIETMQSSCRGYLLASSPP